MKSLLGRFTVGDRCILVILLAVALSTWLLFRGTAGAMVIVEQEGQIVFTASLRSHHRVSLPGSVGPTVLVVEAGKAWISQSSCPHHFCQHQGAIAKSGEALVCLPNRLLVRIEGPPSSVTEYEFLSY